LYDELDAVIDKIQEDLKPDQKSLKKLRAIADTLRNIRDRLPDEIDEVTVITTNNAVSDVLMNGKPVKCYCVVPREQLRKYLMQRGFENVIDARKEDVNATVRLIRTKHRETKTKATTKRSRKQ